MLIIFSLVLFIIGIAYFYKPDAILIVNKYIKKIFFNDTNVLLHRKKIGAMYVGLSVILFYLSLHIPHLTRSADQEKIKIDIYRAQKYFYQGQYDKSEKILKEIIKLQPHNLEVLKLLALLHFYKGEYKISKSYCDKIFLLKGEDEKIKKIYDIILKKNL